MILRFFRQCHGFQQLISLPGNFHGNAGWMVYLLIFNAKNTPSKSTPSSWAIWQSWNEFKGVESHKMLKFPRHSYINKGSRKSVKSVLKRPQQSPERIRRAQDGATSGAFVDSDLCHPARRSWNCSQRPSYCFQRPAIYPLSWPAGVHIKQTVCFLFSPYVPLLAARESSCSLSIAFVSRQVELVTDSK